MFQASPEYKAARAAQSKLFKVAADALIKAGVKDARSRWSVGMLEQASKTLEETPLPPVATTDAIIAARRDAIKAVQELVDATDNLRK